MRTTKNAFILVAIGELDMFIIKGQMNGEDKIKNVGCVPHVSRLFFVEIRDC